jgi:hypothetical protein
LAVEAKPQVKHAPGRVAARGAFTSLKSVR